MEEPDPQRSALEIEAHIMEDIAWLGLDWDEGPDRGGPAGPYRQGERLAIYRAQAETLLADGTAYPCFCADAVLAADRTAAQAQGLPYRYAGHCRDLPKAIVERRRAAGESHAIRFRTPPAKVFVHAAPSPSMPATSATSSWYAATASRPITSQWSSTTR
jgi:glutamyl/glutaminyl-tRNA synthetase